jgi:hypothetical protein
MYVWIVDRLLAIGSTAAAQQHTVASSSSAVTNAFRIPLSPARVFVSHVPFIYTSLYVYLADNH